MPTGTGPTTLRQAIQRLNHGHPSVRIGLSEAANFGHQSAGIEVARRLITEGYVGTLELVAPASVRERLVPLMASLPPQARVAIIAPEEAQRSPVKLGVYGGLDSIRRRGEVAAGHPEANARVNAEVCLILQPLQWRCERAITRRDPGGAVRSEPLAMPGEAGFHYTTYAPERLPSVLETALTLVGRPGLLAPLQRIARAVQAGELELQLAYGLHQTANYQSTVDCLTDALTLCNQTVNKPTLLLAVLPRAEKQGQLDLPRLEEHPAGDAALDGLLRGSSVGGLQCHSLPEPAFRCLVQLSTYAPVLEGANTTNYARVLSRDYLSCNVSTTALPEVEGFAEVRARCMRVPRDLRLENAAEVASLLMEARDRGSQASRYFQALGRALRSPSHDQIAIGLAAAVAPIGQEHP